MPITNVELQKELDAYNREQSRIAKSVQRLFESEPEYGYKVAPKEPKISKRDKKILRLINTRWSDGGDKIICPECDSLQYTAIKFITPYYVNDRWVKMAETTCVNCNEPLRWWFGFADEKEGGFLDGKRRTKRKEQKREKRKAEKSVQRINSSLRG